MTQNLNLTKKEARLARCIDRGEPPAATCQKLCISYNTYRVHLGNIRRKMRQEGMLDYPQPQEGPEALQKLTPAQDAVLSLLATGMSYNQICRKLCISKSTAMNHTAQGCKRLGIASKGISRTDQLQRIYSATEKVYTMEDF